jgi:hypothetical protein
MKKKTKLTAVNSTLVAISALAASIVSAEAQSATATISGVKSGSVYDYTITLDNTGTTQLDSFWYGWIQFENDLGAAPSSAANSLGWANNLDGDSIQYVGNAGDALAAGKSATFTFVSTETPAEITTPPQGESVAYVNGTGIFSPSLVAVPESTSPALLAVGCLGVIMIMRKNSGKSPVSN